MSQSGSKVVDPMLIEPSVMEPITVFSYDPEKSLSQSLNEMAIGLELLHKNLGEIQMQLNQVADVPEEVHPSLGLVVHDISHYSEDTAELSLQMIVIGQKPESLPTKLDNVTQGVAGFG